MKTMRITAVLAVASLLFGCATTFKPWKLSEVKEGMDRAEVIAVLGEPDSAETRDGGEYLYYSFQEELAPAPEVSLETPEGIDRRVEEFNRVLEETRYEVVLVDGKLINYKQLDQ